MEIRKYLLLCLALVDFNGKIKQKNSFSAKNEEVKFNAHDIEQEESGMLEKHFSKDFSSLPFVVAEESSQQWKD